MMPQKKNPDVAELTRGKAGTAVGRLAGLLAMLKGLPLAYNRDLQEDKRAAFDQVDDLIGALGSLTVCVRGIRFNAERMAAAAGDGLTVATDVAEQLVRDGVPFREAHHQVASRVSAGERFASRPPSRPRGRVNRPRLWPISWTGWPRHWVNNWCQAPIIHSSQARQDHPFEGLVRIVTRA